MRSRSLKRQQQMRAFRKLIAAFLEEEEHATCEFPLGCTEPSQTIHHSRGRFGRRLLQREYWRGSCHFHNNYAETNTGESLDCGWLVRIESVDGAA
jgi:hypothetical protein